MKPNVCSLVVGVAILITTAAAAGADEVDPNFLSKLRSVTPAVGGLELTVLHRGDEFELVNRTKKQVLVEGYGGEPYLRFLPDGTVLQNRRSPATYLNQDRYATKRVPSFAKSEAKPVWKRVARGGSYEWHDHRLHYMGKGTPKQVKDESKRQKIFDWSMRMKAGGEPVVAAGTLFWIPTATADDGGSGWLPYAAFGALAAALLAVLVLRRRRGVPSKDAPSREAW
jgi:MYXO-CTERM domain-containing protein